MNNIDKEKLEAVSEDNYIKISFCIENNTPTFTISNKLPKDITAKFFVETMTKILRDILEKKLDLKQWYQDTIKIVDVLKKK